MDPDANLAEQRRIIARMLADGSESIDTGDAVRLAELAQALDEWIAKGGFLPKAWVHKTHNQVARERKAAKRCADCGKVGEITARMIRAFLLGIRDGIESPYDLGSGLTWADDQGENEWYDRGVNVGQAVYRAGESVLTLGARPDMSEGN